MIIIIHKNNMSYIGVVNTFQRFHQLLKIEIAELNYIIEEKNTKIDDLQNQLQQEKIKYLLYKHSNFPENCINIIVKYI